MTVLAFDTETQKLASEVEEDYAYELDGESAWSRPDLFGFAAGVIVDVDINEALRYGPEQAREMIAALQEAETTVGYNSSAFDLSVLAAYGDVEPLRERHVDLCNLVREQLAVLAEEHQTEHRLRQGGLDGLCRANGLAGKTASGVDAPTLYREGRIEELLRYCEADVRLTAALYRTARKHGGLQVDPYHHDADRQRVYLPRTTLSFSV